MLSGTVTDREIEMVDNDDVGFTEERYVTAESNFRDWYRRAVRAWNDADIAALTGPDGGGTNSPGVGYRGRNARVNTPVDREAALNAFSASMVR